MSSGSMDYASEDSPLLRASERPREQESAQAFPAWVLGLREPERRWLLFLNDALWTLGAPLGVAAAWGVPIAQGIGLSCAWFVAAIACFYASELYSLGPTEERALLKGMGFGAVLTLFLAWQAALPLNVLVSLGLAAGLATGGLLLSRRFLTWVFASAAASRRMLLLCEEAEALEVVDEIRRYPQCGLLALGLVAEQEAAPTLDALSVLGAPHQLPTLVERLRSDGILAGAGALKGSEWRGQLAPHEETIDLPSLFERLSRRIPVRYLDERYFIERFTWMRGLGYRTSKRCLDLCFSLIGCALALPLFPFIAAAIYLGDRGPLIYSQERTGLNGRPFKVYKFRTMRIDAEKDGAVWARTNDDRVTAVGRFLRRSRLDELPQLWNILLGEMSLVGPRPERPEFVAELARAIPHYQCRHLVLPGLTGWAQVRFPYGASVQDSEEKLNYDLYYLKHRSCWFDLLILLRTVGVVLNKTGAR
ncbi:UDP-N-acetylgalactosamine-undecaprenyl-phosphate N-acetylgalactosaminephosphotransferase [compost metagenome]